MNSLSVVIPTKDRAAALARTLDALEAQEVGVAEVEVIVIDNGSNDETVAQVRRRTESGVLPIRLLEQPNGGPAAARNAGVEAAGGDVLLFLGDDTEPADEKLAAAHLELHRSRDESTYGVLGRITWTPRKQVTPFMRWLENGGPQFHYCDLEPGPVEAASYFYSSHVSLRRELFEQVGGFDVRFPTAAVEDTELGVRLAETGLELDYHPELLVLHDHPTTPHQSLRRSVAVGRSAALYNSLRPDRPHPGVQEPSGTAWTIVSAAEPILAVLAQLPLPPGLRERVWLAMTRAGYARGYRSGAASK